MVTNWLLTVNAAQTLPCNPGEIDVFLARPTPGVLETVRRLPGDIMVVGAGGKMGPTLCLMAAAALRETGSSFRVKAVSRFSNSAARQLLEKHGLETIPCDLLDRAEVAKLPDAPNILFLAGQKFGTSDAPELTWAMNTLVPAHVAERYATARIVAFSTGCVYSFATVTGGGSREEDAMQPLGDYANSCLGRERIFSYYARKNGTQTVLFRLNYSIDFRYGVLVDVAQKVLAGQPIDVTSGHANVIWQGDACARAIQALELAASPALPINITGPETISIRSLALEFGRRFGVEVKFTGTEADRVWLNDASKSFAHWGYPSVSLGQMVEWIAAWIQMGGGTLGKPTHFETRDGTF
jgi:nucleoside-diphosphate-sugar epimerase